MTDKEMSSGKDDQTGFESGADVSAGERDLTEPIETTLVEVAPGMAAVFGEVPRGFALIDFPLMPEEDHSALANLLAAVGQSATASGNLAQSAQSLRGLYRIADKSQKVLNRGGTLASKDGANLGAIFSEGKIVAQARFVPVNLVSFGSVMSAAGPALSMLAIQVQLASVQDLVAENIVLTKQTLQTIRNEQWSELEGLVKAIDGAFREANQIGMITHSVWESVAPHRALLAKQSELYRKNVREHVRQIAASDGRERREYLEREAEPIIFDSYALLSSIRAYAQFQTLRAAQVRNRIDTDENERDLFELITAETPHELETAMEEVQELILQLIRELRIIAELPGRRTAPLTKRRRDRKSAALTCGQLLDAVEPLADVVQPKVPNLEAPEILCGPATAELSPYLDILRWYIQPGEILRALAIGYSPKKMDVAGVLPALLAKRVDATWESLDGTFGDGVLKKAAPSAIAAVTDRRVLVADAEELRRRGEISADIPLTSISLVRKREVGSETVRPTVDLITDAVDVQIMFPEAAASDTLNQFVSAVQDVQNLVTDRLEVGEKSGLARSE